MPVLSSKQEHGKNFKGVGWRHGIRDEKFQNVSFLSFQNIVGRGVQIFPQRKIDMRTLKSSFRTFWKHGIKEREKTE